MLDKNLKYLIMKGFQGYQMLDAFQRVSKKGLTLNATLLACQLSLTAYMNGTLTSRVSVDENCSFAQKHHISSMT